MGLLRIKEQAKQRGKSSSSLAIGLGNKRPPPLICDQRPGTITPCDGSSGQCRNPWCPFL
jgi:hypothetical protein